MDEEGAAEGPAAIRTDDGRLTYRIEFTIILVEVQLMNARSIMINVCLPTWFSSSGFNTSSFAPGG